MATEKLSVNAVETDSKVMSSLQVARLLGVTARTISKWVDQGHFPAIANSPGGHRRFDRFAVEAFAEDRLILLANRTVWQSIKMTLPGEHVKKVILAVSKSQLLRLCTRFKVKRIVIFFANDNFPGNDSTYSLLKKNIPDIRIFNQEREGFSLNNLFQHNVGVNNQACGGFVKGTARCRISRTSFLFAKKTGNSAGYPAIEVAEKIFSQTIGKVNPQVA